MWVAEAGNRPFGYDPHSYTSHHRQQLLQKSAKNLVMGCVVSFGQTLEPKRLKICQEMNFLWPFCQWEVVWHMWLSCVRCGILMLDHWNQKNAKTTKKLASYGLLPSVRKMGFTSHFIYLTLSHKTYVLTLFNIIFYLKFIYPTQHDPIYPLGPFLLRGYLIISLNSGITKCEMGVSKPFHSVK